MPKTKKTIIKEWSNGQKCSIACKVASQTTHNKTTFNKMIAASGEMNSVLKAIKKYDFEGTEEFDFDKVINYTKGRK